MKFLIAFSLAAASLFAQNSETYTATQTTVLAGTAEVITIQLGRTVTRNVEFIGVAITTSAACDVTLERDGTSATTTPIAAVKVNRDSPDSIASAYRNSNVGAGIILSSYSIPATSTLSLSLIEKHLLRGDNLSLRTSAITGTVQITFQWKEK